MRVGLCHRQGLSSTVLQTRQRTVTTDGRELRLASNKDKVADVRYLGEDPCKL